MRGVKQRTRRSWPEAARDSVPCAAVVAPMMASMHDWKPTQVTELPALTRFRSFGLYLYAIANLIASVPDDDISWRKVAEDLH
jgi:hypothetical protein